MPPSRRRMPDIGRPSPRQLLRNFVRANPRLSEQCVERPARLDSQRRLCQKEPIVVTVNGVPAFQIVPLDQDDDLIDQLLEHNPGFRRFKEQSNLPFAPLAQFKKADLEARSQLYRQIAERIWNPDDLMNGGQP